MLIHDSAMGTNEVKFDLEGGKTQHRREGVRKSRKYLAVVDARTPPMNAHDP